MPELPHKKDGDPLEPRDLNLLYREHRRRRGMHGAGGIDVSGANSGTDRPVISLSRSQKMFARLTDIYATGYAWEEVTLGAGRTVDLSGISGTPATGQPAFERRIGDTLLYPDGEIYTFTKSPASNEWVFPHRKTAGSGCFWAIYFVGCAGFYPLVDGVTWSITVAGVTVASGVGNTAYADSTSLSGGPVVVNWSKSGFVSGSRTLSASIGTCPDNSFIVKVEMTPDASHTCCRTKLPGVDIRIAGCADPLPNAIPLTTVLGVVTLNYVALNGGWLGSIDIAAESCTYDSYGNCTGTTGTTPVYFTFTCDSRGYGILGVGLRIDVRTGTAIPLGPEPLTCFVGCGYIASYGLAGTTADAVGPYTCYPRSFNFEDTLYYQAVTLGPLIPIPGNPAAGPATLG